MTRLLALLLGAAALLSAETNAERGKRVVNEAVAALGGDKFLSIEDRIEEGRAYSFYRERLSGLARAKIYTRYLSAAGHDAVAQRERQAFGKDEDYGILFFEDKAYEVTFRGARPIPQDRWDRYVLSTRRNILYFLGFRDGQQGFNGRIVHAGWENEDLTGCTVRLNSNGGERGIRTLGRVSPTHAFQACALNRSAISPGGKRDEKCGQCRPHFFIV